MPTIYDKAEWHIDGDFPDDLKVIHAHTHTGMYLGWLITKDLIGEEFRLEWQNEILRVFNRKLSGPAFFQLIDGCFDDAVLNDEGNRFTQEYFEFQSGLFLSDYEEILTTDVPTMYHAEDTWENFELLAKRLDDRLYDWRRRRRKRWWKIGGH